MSEANEVSVDRFVVQSFRLGVSTVWNDEAWSLKRVVAKDFMDRSKARCPDCRWRIIIRKPNAGGRP